MIFWVFYGGFSPQMSNNLLCEQVGAANCVALWSTSRKTARRSRTQVSCRLWGGCGSSRVQLCLALLRERAVGRGLGSSRGVLLSGQPPFGEEAASCSAKLGQFFFFKTESSSCVYLKAI